MFGYDVDIVETSSLTIHVEADSEKKAIKQAKAGKGSVIRNETTKTVRATRTTGK